MKIQHLMALVVLSLATVPGARAAIREFKARTLGLLILACLLVAAPATAQVNYLNYGGVAVVSSSPNASGDIVIASTFSGYPVGIILNSAFSGCTNLRSVTIPSSINNIQSPVFSGCTSLTNLSVDAANPAFSSLNGVLLNKTQTTLIAFPPGRGNYVIPNGITSIGGQAFYNCTSLTNVIIGNSITSIVNSAFFGCTNLTSVTIPNSVTTIGSSVFSGCASLTNLSVDAANPALSSLDGVLFNKAQTTLIIFPPGRGSYVIPNSVTVIGPQAFSGCTNLTNVIIGNNVTSIVQQAFGNCTALTSVTIPDSVTQIGTTLYSYPPDGAFSGCTSLTNVLIGNSVTNIGGAAFFGCTNLTRVTIPNSVTIIGERTFENCTSLTSATIGNGVISIGGEAFYRCTSLTSVTIPDSVTQIGTTLYAGSGGNAFAYCTSLTNVIIGHSVTNIGAEAFSACSNLTRLTIPASVINLGYAAFYNSSRLTNFTFLGNAPRLIFDMDGGYAQFASVGAGAKVYYYCGTTGWGTSYGPLPTVMLCAPQFAPGSAGVKPGGFGFTLTFLTNQTIVVEASTNLANWQPIWTNTQSGASADILDPAWMNNPRRFYRARSD